MLTDAALSVVTALGQCKAHLSDVKEGRQLAGALLFQIMTSYLQVRFHCIACFFVANWSIEGFGCYVQRMVDSFSFLLVINISHPTFLLNIRSA